MNEANELIEKLKQYYKVATSQELAEHIGVAQTTVSGWKQRNSVNAVRRKIYELGLDIDLDNKRNIDDRRNDVYLIDQAIFTAKRELFRIFESNFIDATIWNKSAKDILLDVLGRIDIEDETYTIENAKGRLIDKIEEAEIPWLSILKKSRKPLLGILIKKYFSNVEVYAMIKYPDEVFDYIGFWGKSKKPKK